MRTAFSTPARSMLKTMIMSTGEFEFDTLFYNTDDGRFNQGTTQSSGQLENDLLYPGATYILWILFIIMMPIVLTNLLVGTVYNRTENNFNWGVC